MTVAYDGTAYAGWQVQPRRVTIQSLLEKAIAQVCRQRVRVTGSGRTDSGVHALAQVASFRLDHWKAPPAALARALNSKLPPDIAILAIEEAAEDFHAIRDAVGKRYRYQLRVGGVRDAFDHRYRWHLPGPLDLDAMRQAAELIRGRRDFASFQAAGSDRKTTVREVRALEIIEQPPPETAWLADTVGPNSHDPQGRAGRSASGPATIRNVAIEIEADGFLYNMVRNIVGSLVEVGRGKRSPHWVADVISARDRKQAGPTAPPHGLFMMWVQYPREQVLPSTATASLSAPPATGLPLPESSEDGERSRCE